MTETTNIHGTGEGNLTAVLPEFVSALFEPPPGPAVYMLYAGGQIKIGTSRNFYTRLGAIAGQSPVPVFCVVLLPGGRKLERILHQRFRADRIHGEWFNLSPALREFINEWDGDQSFAEWSLGEVEPLSTARSTQGHTANEREKERIHPLGDLWRMRPLHRAIPYEKGCNSGSRSLPQSMRLALRR